MRPRKKGTGTSVSGPRPPECVTRCSKEPAAPAELAPAFYVRTNAGRESESNGVYAEDAQRNKHYSMILFT